MTPINPSPASSATRLRGNVRLCVDRRGLGPDAIVREPIDSLLERLLRVGELENHGASIVLLIFDC